MKIGYLGPSGSYTHEAATTLFERSDAPLELKPIPRIALTFESLNLGEVDRVVVPYENMIQGPVTETLDGLYRYHGSIRIVDMIVRPIRHALGALAQHGEIKNILSKDQALAQCSRFLAQEYPDAELTAVSSTSFAMETIVRNQLDDSAAIGSAFGIRQYGLRVLAENIGNEMVNKTRFAVLGSSAESVSFSGHDATALVVYPHRNRVGFLEDLIEIISTRHHLNLCSIHSRPDSRGAFLFYLELEGNLLDPIVARCLKDIEERFSEEDVEVHSFGSFPRSAFNQSSIRKIGIVGGTGAMGKWFHNFFTVAGIEVSVTGKNGPLSYAECVEGSDVVIINVPIENTIEVVETVGPLLRAGQVLADNTSIKTQPVQAMLQVVGEGVEVLGMHTVFGPAVENVRGQNIVFTPTLRSGAKSQEFETLFYKYGARITRTTPENHDRHMAFHQNLEHFSKLALGDIFRSYFSQDELGSIDRYSTPNSRASLATMARVLKSDPHLLVQIQMNNREARSLIEHYVHACTSLLALVADSRPDKLENFIRSIVEELDSNFLDDKKRQSVAMDNKME